MTAVQDLGRLAQTSQGLALTRYNVRKLKKKNISAKDIVDGGVTNVVGIGLMRATGSAVSLL